MPRARAQATPAPAPEPEVEETTSAKRGPTALTLAHVQWIKDTYGIDADPEVVYIAQTTRREFRESGLYEAYLNSEDERKAAEEAAKAQRATERAAKAASTPTPEPEPASEAPKPRARGRKATAPAAAPAAEPTPTEAPKPRSRSRAKAAAAAAPAETETPAAEAPTTGRTRRARQPF